MSEGDVTKYNELKKLDVIDFFNFYFKWRKDIELKSNQIKKTKKWKNT